MFVYISRVLCHHPPLWRQINKENTVINTIIFGLSSVIVWLSVVLKRNVGNSDSHFDSLSSCHLQTESDIVSSVDDIYVSGY